MKIFWPVYLAVAVSGTAAVFFSAPRFAKYRARPSLPTPSSLPAPQPLPSAHLRPPAPSPSAPQPLPAAHPRPVGADLQSAPSWGVTQRETPFYSLTGGNQGKIPAGTVFRKRSVLKSSHGYMLAVTPYVPGHAYSRTSLVARAAAVLFAGDPAELSAVQYASLTNYYALAGKIEARRAELQQAVAAKCPHYAEAADLYKRYHAFLEESRALAIRRDRAAGPERTRLETVLSERKTEEARLADAMKSANEKYKEWKDRNRTRFEVEDDDRIEAWQTERERLRERIPGWAK